MKLIFPNNIFSTFFILSMEDKFKKNIIVKDSSLLTQELNFDEDAVALIPSLDLINQRDLKVSSKLGISFEGLLSNSYVYFNHTNDEISKIMLRGDISSNDVIMSKIIFQERYHIKPEIILDTEEQNINRNYVISGNENWNENKYKEGTSISEQISDLLEYPYINYLFASKDESTLRDFHSIVEGIDKKIFKDIDDYLKSIALGEEINSFIKKELNSINYSLSDYEILATKELFQLVYFHGLLDDLFEIKFVG